MLITLGIILLVFALFLIFAVLMQHGRAKNISGVIAGGAETFFGKTKGSTWDKILSKLTTVVAILFVIIVVVVYIMQDVAVENYKDFEDALNTPQTTDTDAEHDHDHADSDDETGDASESETEKESESETEKETESASN